MERNSALCSSEPHYKICSSCNRRLGLWEFNKKRQNKDGHSGSCRECANAANKRYYKKADPLKKRTWDLKRYGLTPQKFEDMATRQGHRCKICRRREKLCVDHCHITKEVRGLLCNFCNRGLGMFQEDVIRLADAIEYLGGWR